jgi:uncharacterized RDD family membrane protein YckC
MQDENPYQSPAEVSLVEPAVTALPLSVASEGARFINFLLDGLAFRLLQFALGWILAQSSLRAHGGVLPILLSLLVMMSYYIMLEAICGKTLAKFITRTKVVSADGTKPTFAQIVGRTFSRLIPFEAFSFLESCPVGWHDKLSHTRVVPDR